MAGMTRRYLLAILLPFAGAWAMTVSYSPGNGEYLGGRLLVKLAAGVRNQLLLTKTRFGIADIDAECERLGVDSIWPLYVGKPGPTAQQYGCDLAFGLRFSAAVDAYAAAAALGRLSTVAWAGPEVPLRTCEVPNDFYYSQQWHLPRIGAPVAWDYRHGDTTVIIGLVDNGYEWHHPDIQANIKLNAAEDLNRNGRFDTLPPPAGDLDGIDQDSNGVADDVVGYNFIQNTPNPAPESATLTHSHGTHTWGIANAVTGNGIGVAAACWNCRAIGVRGGTGQIMSPAAVISGIYYLVGRGARILSLSFGSTSASPPMEDACNFARASGCLVVAGAGNSGNSNRFYPAAYDSVIAVAASDEADLRPYWSNFGDWVSVTAPGNTILSTMANHWYAWMSGTSMATPLVASALAWIWSVHPEYSPAQIESTLYAGCEPIPETLYQQGLMGRGRISLSQVAMPLMYCDLRLTDLRINDANGNNNGRLDPGETVALIVTYSNTSGWRNAANVRATLTCQGSGIRVLRDVAGFPDIPAGASGSCSADSFVISAENGAAPQRLDIRLRVQASPSARSPDTALPIACGQARIMIVDDDNGAGYERYYLAAADSNRLLYRFHDRATQGSPLAETLRNYPVVIWFCGDDSTTTLQPEDRSALVSFLRNGGNLMLSGQSVARDLHNRQSAFLGDYLRAEFVTDSTGQPFLAGLPDDPITRAETLVAGGSGGAGNGFSLDGIRPINGASASARYVGFADTTVSGVIRYAGSYRLVFLSIPFEALDHSPSRYLQRAEFLRRVLAYFGEALPGTAEPLPATTTRRQPVFLPTVVSRSAEPRFPAPTEDGAMLRVFSAAGRLVTKQCLDAGPGHQQLWSLLGRLPPGVYVVELSTAGISWRQKLVIVTGR